MRRGADVYAGSLLALGAAALFVGTLLSAGLTPALGLPAATAAERTQALADALSLGARPLAFAGGFSFFGDFLLLAASIAFSAKRLSALDDAGWALMAAGFAFAMVAESMIAALLFPLAHASDPTPFLAFKAWFDFLFAASRVPFGLGLIALVWADVGCNDPTLPAGPLPYVGLAIGAAATISGLGFSVGLFNLPLIIGLSVTFGCAFLALFGFEFARRGLSAP